MNIVVFQNAMEVNSRMGCTMYDVTSKFQIGKTRLNCGVQTVWNFTRVPVPRLLSGKYVCLFYEVMVLSVSATLIGESDGPVGCPILGEETLSCNLVLWR